MFRGNHPTRVDEKGRLKIPADFKRLIDEQFGAKFFITSLDGERAQVWPLPEWEKQEAKLAAMPSIPAKRKLLDRISYYGQETEMDAQGRVLIPQVLREAGKLVGDVAVLGKGSNYLEVARNEMVRASFESEPMTTADEESLAEHGW
jgi:transcriptional regulator MraZ